MPTREQYDAYFEPLIGRELDDFAYMERSQNEYEKHRNRNIQLSADIPLQQKARAEAMVADMRRQKKDKVRELALQVQNSQAKGTPIKLPKFDGQEVPVFDLSYVLAESLQHLYSSEDPRAEYYDWVQVQRQIEVDINTNGTTDDEIKARNGFIDFLDDRETELKLIIMLYAMAERGGTGYYKEMAQNKLHFLVFKLSELRRLRDRTQATKSKSDEQERAEKEFERGVQKTAAGIAVAAAAQDMELARQNYLQNQKDALLFDNAIDGVITHYRPVTRNAEEIMAKKERLYSSRKNIHDVLSAMRMGISKEELLAQERPENIYDKQRRLFHRSRGFSRQAFSQLERDSSH